MFLNLFQSVSDAVRLKERLARRRFTAGMLSLGCLMTTTFPEGTIPIAATVNSSRYSGDQHSFTTRSHDCRANVCAIPYPDTKRAGAAKIPRIARAPQFPLANTFLLHSRPGASKVIHLDFDGHATTGTVWNSGGDTITTFPYSFEGDASFSDNELTQFQEIWQRVSECYSPFDVDVTTEQPPVADLMKSGSGDTRWGIRVCIGDSSPSPAPGAGGVAYLGSFNWNTDTPTFVFIVGAGDAKFIADATVHEVGHTLGLEHDGRISPSEEYYEGHGTGVTAWAPNMGVGYYVNLVQWSKGEYASANNQEDDLSIITHPTNNGFGSPNGFGLRVDDGSSTLATALPIAGATVAGVLNVNQRGVIERRTDEDWFLISAAAGTLTLDARGGPENTMLDIRMELYNQAGTLIESSNPVDLLTASINQTVAAGNYFVKIEGVSKGDPLGTGYTDYGSLGQYQITGSVPDGPNPPPPPPESSNVTVSYSARRKTLTLTGDSKGNTVAVSLQSGQLIVTGTNGTKLNNSATISPISHTGKLILNSSLGEGNDSISIVGVDASTVSLNLGGGMDSATLLFCKVRQLTVNGGPGTDSLVTTSSTITRQTVTQVP